MSGFAARLSALEIRYADRKVENLTISKILFWNAGAETIDRSDVANADPLRIEAVKSVELLDVRVLTTNNAASRFEVGLLPDGAAGFDFDFLDKDQGAIIQVIHSGRSSSDLVVRGTVKGAGVPRKRDIRTYSLRLARYLDISVNNSIVVGLGGVMMVYFGYRSRNVTILALGVVAVLTFLGYNALRYRDTRMPRGLEDYARD